MNDFYLETSFNFYGNMYGRLRILDDKSFVRYVLITKTTNEYTNWLTIDEELEKKVKVYYEKKQQFLKKK